ncbi:MAG TPA: ATP cone domain-containing protein, partial [Actinomycetota bacterium]|nr:ATP cone domain-containing protein [Actinomycetota bacterium]
MVDSRLAEEGRVIRRRRECLGCTRRYTTFERAEEVPLLVVKRKGDEEPFERSKVVVGIRRACKNRPVSGAAIEEL